MSQKLNDPEILWGLFHLSVPSGPNRINPQDLSIKEDYDSGYKPREFPDTSPTSNLWSEASSRGIIRSNWNENVLTEEMLLFCTVVLA